MKAVAPMMGGMSTPPVEAQASVAAAVLAEKPVLRIAGMETAPVVSTLEITEPDIDPMKPEAKIETLAAPPRYPPTSPSARSLKNCPPPVRCSTAPKRMKPITTPPKAFIGMPKELSDE